MNEKTEAANVPVHDFVILPDPKVTDIFIRAIRARVAYERRMMARYDQFNGPSKTPKVGDRMVDFAVKFDIEPEEMRKLDVVKMADAIIEGRQRAI